MFTQAYGEERMTVGGEGGPLHVSVFSLTMFTATTVLCNIVKDCPKLEISPGILKIHQGNFMESLLLEMLGTLGNIIENVEPDHLLCTRQQPIEISLLLLSAGS